MLYFFLFCFSVDLVEVLGTFTQMYVVTIVLVWTTSYEHKRKHCYEIVTVSGFGFIIIS